MSTSDRFSSTEVYEACPALQASGLVDLRNAHSNSSQRVTRNFCIVNGKRITACKIFHGRCYIGSFLGPGNVKWKVAKAVINGCNRGLGIPMKIS